jgi:DnaJ-class molecular chaperone
MYPDDDYNLWLELNPCPACDGDGEVHGAGGREHTCETCDGTGVDPDAEYEPGDGDA